MNIFWPKNELTFEENIDVLSKQSINEPFAQETLEFIKALSKRFLTQKKKPEIVALGYWLRKSNIVAMKQHFYEGNTGILIKPRGTTFHIAPSNVDTIFVYSWLLSMLAGNRNVIRVSSKAAKNNLLKIILEELKCNEKIGSQTIICTYPHDGKATELISNKCHTRVVWGGNQTVNVIRSIPLSPLANELVFANRFSIAVLNSKIIEQLDNESFENLIDRFYNDSYWFNQMACSSPRLVIWVGEKSVEFWNRIELKVKQKQFEFDGATQVTKLATSLMLANDQDVKKIDSKPIFSRIELLSMNEKLRESHCGNGIFYEYETNSLNSVTHLISDADQTLTYYGFNEEELQKFAKNIESRGIDRIVPVGQALDFNSVWDGQEFLTSFTRKVVIK